MIRQLCPHCQAGVELPDATAGTAADCPKCGKPIAVPAGYVPTVTPASALPPPPPSSLPPEPPPGFLPPRPAAAAVVVPAVRLPGWVVWLPAAGLAVAFLASLFPWAGSYPGGVRVYSQTAWQAAFGSFTTALLPAELTADEAALTTAVRFSGWVLAYLPLLLVGVLLAGADRLVPAAVFAAPPPRFRWAAPVAAHRNTLLAGVTVLALVFLVLQSVTGFGLDRAATAAAEAKFADQYKAADTPNKQTVAKVLAGVEENRLGMQSTTARDVALLAHLVAAGGAIGLWWLHRRGDKPLPRLALLR